MLAILQLGRHVITDEEQTRYTALIILKLHWRPGLPMHLYVVVVCNTILLMFFSVKPKETKKGFKKSDKVKTVDHREWDSQMTGGGACCTFQGSATRFCYLLECSASKGWQRKLLQYLLEYWAEKLWQEIIYCFRIGVSWVWKFPFQTTPTKQDRGTCYTYVQKCALMKFNALL